MSSTRTYFEPSGAPSSRTGLVGFDGDTARSGRAPGGLCPTVASAATRAAEGLRPAPRQVGGYVIRELIGRGGMGEVYRGEQVALDRSVAIKLLHPHLCQDPQVLRRFEMEARAASRLNHPNSVAVIDFGTDGGVPYLVMEYLPGRDLTSVVEREGMLPLCRIRRIIDAVLAALSEAHELGIVHRDLKPENVILTAHKDGTEGVKVVDFDLAQIKPARSTRFTAPGFAVGTPEYMSPEQILGNEVDGRADLYSLGVMLFELLTGQRPFRDHSVTRLTTKHLRNAPPDPRVVAPARVSAAMSAAILCALEKDASRRFASARDMAIALERAFAATAPASPVAERHRQGGFAPPTPPRDSAHGPPLLGLRSSASDSRGAELHEPRAALLRLERLGSAKLATGEVEQATDAFRRGLEIARSEAARTGEEESEAALFAFTLLLARALQRGGKLVEAEGALGEAIGRAGPGSLERARLLTALGRVRMARGREREGFACFEEALAMLVERRAPSGERGREVRVVLGDAA